MINRSLLALALGAALLVSNTLAQRAPAAAEVKANVHGASTLTVELLART